MTNEHVKIVSHSLVLHGVCFYRDETVQVEKLEDLTSFPDLHCLQYTNMEGEGLHWRSLPIVYLTSSSDVKDMGTVSDTNFELISPECTPPLQKKQKNKKK